MSTVAVHDGRLLVGGSKYAGSHGGDGGLISSLRLGVCRSRAAWSARQRCDGNASQRRSLEEVSGWMLL